MRKVQFLVACALACAAAAPTVAGATEPIPNSMASTGDSITRGFNACGWFSDCTNESWSTGGDSAVNSQYLRILATNPNISGKNFNNAKTGAKMIDLDGQITNVVPENPDYVTILMGANDVC